MASNDAREKLFRELGWETPPKLADEALTHRSFANERGGKRSPPSDDARDNQRLEFLGDAVLGLCASEMLMDAFPDAEEGALSRMRAALVRTDALAEFGRRISLGDSLRLGRGADVAGDRHQANVLADAVEALVAAAYLDGGLARARSLVEKIVAPNLADAASLGLRDPKSELQERVQRDGKRAPVYRLAKAEGPDHDRWFDVEVLVEDEVVATGRGRSKKLAEQAAARAALEKMNTP